MKTLFTPLFQPIANFSGEIYAYEALMRLHGNLEQSPEEQIRHWERSGFIAIADRAMIRAVARSLAMVPYRPGIAVNASIATIEAVGREYVADLAKLVPLTQCVIVELTETAPIQDHAEVARFVRACRDAGIQIALDDCHPEHKYGTEAFIRAMRPSIIKIEGSLLNRSPGGAVPCDIRRLVNTAHRYNADVVIERVTDALVHAHAFAIGADFAQGTHIGVPAPLPIATTAVASAVG